MNNVHIGEIIKYHRQLQGMSQEELADGICSRKYLISLEKGKNYPTSYIIDLLNKKLKCNIYSFYNQVNRHHDMDTHKKIREINELLEKRNLASVKSIIKEIESIPSFQKDEPLQILYYVNAICASNVDQDFSKAIEYAQKGIHVYHPNFHIKLSKNAIFSNIDLILIQCMAVNYCRAGKYKTGLDTLYFLKEYLLPFTEGSIYDIHENSHFEVRLLCSVIYNITSFKIIHKDYDDLIPLIDKTISILKRLSYSTYFIQLLVNKFIAYADQDLQEEAKECYKDIIILGKYFDAINFTNIIGNELQVKYPFMKDEL